MKALILVMRIIFLTESGQMTQKEGATQVKKLTYLCSGIAPGTTLKI